LRLVLPFLLGKKSGQSLPISSHVSKVGTILLLASGIFCLSATAIAYQDIAGFGPGVLSSDTRWSAHKVIVPTGSTFTAGMGSGVDQMVTGSTQHKAAIRTYDDDLAVTAQKGTRPGASDQPMTINRALKGGRVVSSSFKRPPAHFSAGSVIIKSSLTKKTIDKSRGKLAFVAFRSTIEPVRLARAFYHRSPAMKKITPVLRPAAMLAQKAKRLRGKSTSTTLVAFAPVSKSNSNPFKSLFKNTGNRYVKPVLGRGDHKWAAKRLSKRVYSKNEQRCLAVGIYFEARGESVRGQAAVAQVILNRVKNPAYPNSICGVVYQNKSWKNRCQFSFACDGKRDRVNSKKHWRTVVAVAKKATLGSLWIKEVGSSTHYHATYVKPRWAKSMKRMKKIGLHIFYRTKGGGWS
jgi:spore germination cell wall hydrolase CwlJ-like protein